MTEIDAAEAALIVRNKLLGMFPYMVNTFKIRKVMKKYPDARTDNIWLVEGYDDHGVNSISRFVAEVDGQGKLLGISLEFE